MLQTATPITELPDAMQVLKEMQAGGVDLFGGYRPLARRAIAEIIEAQMQLAVEKYLGGLEDGELVDRRNGTYQRRLLTALGDIELTVPRTRRYCPTEVLRAYARREAEVDRLIAAGFVLGLSTRKIGEVLVALLGRPVSPSTVSRVAKTLDDAVLAFHSRPLGGGYRALILDGVVLSRKTGAGALKRPVLVALGLHHDGRKEIIDYQLAASESERQWERFLNSMYKRGLTEECFEMICVDGGKGLLAARHTVYPSKPVQRCWAHKIRNILDKVRKTDHDAVRDDLRDIMNTDTEKAARSAARRFKDRWESEYPKAVKCLRDDLDQLVTCWRYKSLTERKQVRTTNAIERRFREVRRRTRPMGVFQDITSMDRILYAIFTHENKSQGTGAPFALTHKC